MNPWHDTDNLLTEMMGLNRNVLMGIFIFGFLLWQLAENMMRIYAGPNPGALAGMLPLGGTVALCYYVVIPTIRRWNDKLPKGHFEGLADFYFFNPNTLEIANDPEPLPPYLPDASRNPRT